MFAKSLVTRGFSAAPKISHDNKSISLNGQNQYIVSCNEDVQAQLLSSSGDSSRQLVIALWFKRTASRNNSQDAQTLWNHGPTGSANKILSIYIDDNDTEIKIKRGTGSTTTSTSTGFNITNDKWHHLQVRFKTSGTIQAVLDGDFDNKHSSLSTTVYTDSPATQYIGADNNTGTPGKFFPGKIAYYHAVSGFFANFSQGNINAAYNNGELLNANEEYSSYYLQSWITFGDGYRAGFFDGHNNELIHDNANSYSELDLMQGRGIGPGLNSSHWTLGGNWQQTSGSGAFLNSPAGSPDGSSDVLTYEFSGDYALETGWLYRLTVQSSSSTDTPSDTGSTDPESSITFAGHEIINANGWNTNWLADWHRALNTNNFIFTSFSDADSASNSYLYSVRVFKPNKIAYMIGGNRATSIGRDTP